jgi:hypothetical protein
VADELLITTLSDMTSHKKRTLFWTFGMSLGVLSLLVFVGPSIPYKKRSNYVCSVTASTRTDVTWFGLFTSHQRTVSFLENWLKQREPSFQPNWQFMSGQTYFVWGGRSCGYGGTPDAYELTYTLKLPGVQKMSDSQIAGLVETLRHGSAEARKQMIKSFSDEVLQKSD